MPNKPLEYIFPGILAAQAIHTAVKLRIPDLLAPGPKAVAELASACGVHEQALERLLRALTSIEMFAITPEGFYRNSPLTSVLRRDHPQSLHAEGMFLPARFMWLPLGELSESVRTGKPAFELAYGESFFAFLSTHPDEAAIFNRLMAQEIIWTAPALLKSYDFSRFKQLVDVGGGQGLFLINVLAAVPNLTGILFDQPQVVDAAKEISTDGVAARLTVLSGSFFDSVPGGGDAYVLRRVIHDWEDEDAVRILANVRRAMTSDGTLLLIEGLIDSPAHPVGLMDLMMMILGGRERTESEFRSLLQSAGFRLNRIIPAGVYSVIEGYPA